VSGERLAVADKESKQSVAAAIEHVRAGAAQGCDRIDFLGIPVCAVDMRGAIALVDSAIAERSPLHIGVINAAKVVGMARDPELRSAVLSSDAIFADGMSIVWASRLLGVPLPERVTGIDLMMNLLARGSELGYRVFCLGAREDVSKRVAEIIGRDFPGVQLVGRHHGYFSKDEEADIVKLIAAARPDMLFVAMTSPMKENFLARWGSELNTTVTHGVGGSFDVLAGYVMRAPPLWCSLGLEWLYRLKQEPRRLWKRYLVTNTVFCNMVLRAWLRRVRAGSEAHGRSSTGLGS